MKRLLPLLFLVSCAQTPPVSVTAPDGTTMTIGNAVALGGRVGALVQAPDGTRAAVYGNSEEGARELGKTARFGIGWAGAKDIASDLGSAFSGYVHETELTKRAVDAAAVSTQTPLP